MMSTFFLRRLTEVDEQASSVLETALVLPVLVLLLCVAVQLPRLPLHMPALCMARPTQPIPQA
jgi:hypothetical protein